MDSLGSLDPYRLEAPQNGLLSTAKLSGSARPLLTTLPQFVTLLAHSGLNGPHHLHAYSLDNRGEVLGEGAQFTVFTDRARLLDKVVVKRVKQELIETSTTPSGLDNQRKRHLRTLELEISALCVQSLRDHPNIVNVLSWGFDYPTRDLKSAIPVLFVEKAKCSLRSLLKQEPSLEVRHQLISDISAGLACLHETEIVHGDLKPDNILIFEQTNLSVPYIAKLNDFGMCIPLKDKSYASYQSYGGTPGWLAPEVQNSETKGSENLSDGHLLLKCDIFSFGLVALSIFVTSGEPPFGQLETTARDSYLQAGSQLVKKASVALSSSVTKIMENLVLATLNANPSQRSNVNQVSLADDSPGYISW